MLWNPHLSPPPSSFLPCFDLELLLSELFCNPWTCFWKGKGVGSKAFLFFLVQTQLGDDQSTSKCHDDDGHAAHDKAKTQSDSWDSPVCLAHMEGFGGDFSESWAHLPRTEARASWSSSKNFSKEGAIYALTTHSTTVSPAPFAKHSGGSPHTQDALDGPPFHPLSPSIRQLNRFQLFQRLAVLADLLQLQHTIGWWFFNIRLHCQNVYQNAE